MATMSHLFPLFLLFLHHTLANQDESVHVPSKCPLIPPKSIRTSPIVIAHRGASFSLPEHSLPAYRLALELGADYIEPDLVGTKDGHLVIVHSINLNITTNVAQVFPDRFSTLENQTGYYSYDFTLEEIQQLSVKQRMPQARSTVFDGLFGVPSLQDALKLLHEWNHDILPLISPESTLLQQQAGIYAELKDPEIYEKMTNKSMVDVFFEELQSAVAEYAPNTDSCDSLKFNEYRVPPLVVQSFDAKALQQVHEQWKGNTTIPPLVLLAHAYQCFQEDFWFHVGESRDYIQGIGVDKACLVENYNEFMDKAEEYELAVHAWVERRELSELGDGFDDIQQELKYLYCDVGVHGVFSENVADAVLVAQMGCDQNTTQDLPTMAPTTSSSTQNDDNNSAGASTPSNPNSLCYESVDEQAMYIGFAAGVMGIFIGSIVTLWISNSRCCRRRRQRRQRMVVPVHEEGEMI
jgi:glycerophosphoryl diester phosphodiesterase